MEAYSEFSTRPLEHELAARLDRVFEDALDRGHFSGAAIIVSARDSFTLSRNWGHERRGGEPIGADTRFDLASLTKPLVTVPLVMAAIARAMLGLDDKLSRFFPAPADKRDITIRHLLGHSSGLSPFKPFFLNLIGIAPDKRREAMVSMILADPLDTAPGSAASYSDFGYILLGVILEDLFGQSLDRLAREMLFEPLGLDELHFCPITTGLSPETVPEARHPLGFPSSGPEHSREPDAEGFRYVAAELCPWRKRLLVGEVSDENAWTLGGVAGHAGLFGSARGVFGMVSFLRDVYKGKLESGLLPRDLVRRFWTRTGFPPGSTWALGFDTPRLLESSAGRFFSQTSIGHLGFTGTSFWLDLDRDVLVVLLANRVHPTRDNEAFKKFRPLVHDIVMEALTANCALNGA